MYHERKSVWATDNKIERKRIILYPSCRWSYEIFTSFFTFFFLITVSWHRITQCLLIWRSVPWETDIVFTAQFTGRSFNGFGASSLTLILCRLFHWFERWYCIDSPQLRCALKKQQQRTSRSRNIRNALLPTAYQHCHIRTARSARKYRSFSLSPSRCPVLSTLSSYYLSFFPADDPIHMECNTFWSVT